MGSIFNQARVYSSINLVTKNINRDLYGERETTDPESLGAL